MKNIHLTICLLLTAVAAFAQGTPWADPGSDIAGSTKLKNFIKSKINWQTGAGAPTSVNGTVGQDFYFDTTGLLEYICTVTGTPGTWKVFRTDLGVANPRTATYQVVAADFSDRKFIPVASGTFNVTMVASGSQPPDGQYIYILNYGSGVPTIVRSGQNLNGGTASISIPAGSATAPTAARIWSNGTDYFVAVMAPTVITSPNSTITVGGTAYARTVDVVTTLISQKFFGTAAPGSVTGNLPGDFFTDTTNHNEYVCNAASGTAAPACTSVATAGWLKINGGGSTDTCAATFIPGISAAIDAYPSAGNNTQAFSTSSGNNIMAYRVHIPCAFTPIKLSFYLITAGSGSCTTSIAIYDSTGARVIYSGVMTTGTTVACNASAGVKSLTASTSPAATGLGTLYQPGDYWIATTSNETTGIILSGMTQAAPGNLMNSGATTMIGFAGGTSGGVCPTTLPTLTAGPANLPMFALGQ